MNRAFVSENDGWGFCIEKMESCMCANEKGQCVLDACRLYPPAPEQAAKEQVDKAEDKPE